MDSESEKSWPGRLGIAIPVTDDDVYVFFSLLVVMTIRRVRETIDRFKAWYLSSTPGLVGLQEIREYFDAHTSPVFAALNTNIITAGGD